MYGDLEHRTPLRGHTLEEHATLAGARVIMNEAARDLDREVMMGNAATPGEALAQLLAARGDESLPSAFVDCGTLDFDDEGNPRFDYPDRQQLTFPWE